MRLIEQVKKIKSKTRTGLEVTDDEIEVALAYLKGDISLNQIDKTIYPNHKGGSAAVTYRLVRWIKEAYTRELIEIKK